jgi:hypothetical protein
VNLWTALRFIFGNAGAIREVARNRAALWTGIVLVVLTGIARNYDQTFFLESPMWLIGPLAFSFFSGSFLYTILIKGFARRHFPEENRRDKQWTTFMALFWMTAPVAWLYAIPVERFLARYHAAQANITLLAIVSLWRVLLMSRILSVLFKMHFIRALAWVLVAASLEVIVVFFLGPFFNGSLTKRILAGMAGMRNAPEDALFGSVLGFVWGWSWAVLLVGLVVGLRYFRETIPPLPQSQPGNVPWLQLMIVAGIWAFVAIGPQKEQHRFITHAALVDKGAYSEALAYLGKHQQSDFPPSRRIEPNPYEYRVWSDLPPTVSLLTPDAAPWIRNLYLESLSTTMSHYHTGYDSMTNVAAMLSAIEQLPEARRWFQTNENALARDGLGLRQIKSEPLASEELIARTNILGTLRRMGMAETNLAQLTETK